MGSCVRNMHAARHASDKELAATTDERQFSKLLGKRTGLVYSAAAHAHVAQGRRVAGRRSAECAKNERSRSRTSQQLKRRRPSEWPRPDSQSLPSRLLTFAIEARQWLFGNERLRKGPQPRSGSRSAFGFGEGGGERGRRVFAEAVVVVVDQRGQRRRRNGVTAGRIRDDVGFRYELPFVGRVLAIRLDAFGIRPADGRDAGQAGGSFERAPFPAYLEAGHTKIIIRREAHFRGEKFGRNASATATNKRRKSDSRREEERAVGRHNSRRRVHAD
ncbi:hypothetical protein V9T40_011741 [Parthenolecanium corni]|uniref:Uncharacterized protein n=1 Tax=Parthenolecanium corni TaxID=536013 RepID=A0AAN9T8C6_9HEMI